MATKRNPNGASREDFPDYKMKVTLTVKNGAPFNNNRNKKTFTIEIFTPPDTVLQAMKDWFRSMNDC